MSSSPRKFLCFPMLDKNSVLASFFLIIYETREIKKIPSLRCALYAADTLPFGTTQNYFLLWKQFLMWTEMRSFLFVVVCRVLYVDSLQCEREFHLAFLWKHLLRRFTDCTVRFFFEQHFLVQCIRCTGMHQELQWRFQEDLKFPSQRFISFSRLTTHKRRFKE